MMSLMELPDSQPSRATESMYPRSAIRYSAIPHLRSTLSGRKRIGVSFFSSIPYRISMS